MNKKIFGIIIAVLLVGTCVITTTNAITMDDITKVDYSEKLNRTYTIWVIGFFHSVNDTGNRLECDVIFCFVYFYYSDEILGDCAVIGPRIDDYFVNYDTKSGIITDNFICAKFFKENVP